MRHHLFCVTIDTDPDGLNGKTVNRRSLAWEGLKRLGALPSQLGSSASLAGVDVPVTWFIRIDGQLRDVLGSSLYLVENFRDLWEEVSKHGDELAWHPHLYRQPGHDIAPSLITDPLEACDELERLWEDMREWRFVPQAFRNGEGWLLPPLLATVEAFGMPYDSSAIPGLTGNQGHPRNWEGAPNQPYYPDGEDLRRPGRERALLELPMNTWQVQAPYDKQPRLRYMNPAVHSAIFAQSVEHWKGTGPELQEDLSIWVLICHPDELVPVHGPDVLYGRSLETIRTNLSTLVSRVRQADQTFEFVTLSRAGQRWKQYKGTRP